MDEAAIILLALRLIVPLLILRFPLFGILLCAGIDIVDYSSMGNMADYQLLDKLLDTYYLSFAAITVLRWKDVWAKRIALGSYLWRVIGVILVFATDQRWLLMVFPNFFEMFFIFYLLFAHLSKHTKLITSGAITGLIVGVLLVPKLIQEYILHIYQPAPQIAPTWITYTLEHFAWAALPLALLPPLGVLIYCVCRARFAKQRRVGA